MAATAQQVEEAKRVLAQLDATTQALKATPTQAARTEQMLSTQTPPGVTTLRNSEQKPFSLHRFLVGFKGKADPSLCPHEVNVLERYTKALRDSNCELDAQKGGGGLWLPMDLNETYGGRLTESSESEANIAYVKAVFDNTRPYYDPDEAAWLARRSPIYRKAQSAFVDEIGGSLVAPPVQGAVIPLVRPNTAFLAAGAQSMTLPPNGRFVAPRVTSPPQVQAIGEGQTTPTSDLGTGQMELTAKKIAGAVIMSEEASAFTSGTMDAIAQAELGRSLGLQIDAYAFYGIGSTQIPAGITANVYANRIFNVVSQNPTALGIGANGNTLLPQYGDLFPSFIEERSYGIEGIQGSWIMRPAAYANVMATRASAVTPNDQQGPMVDILRRFQESGPNVFKGRRVVRTTNLRNNRVKGTSTNLSDVFYGLWNYGIMASYAAINFQQGHNGVTFLQGQYIIRGTMFGDIGYQYPDAFLWYQDVYGISGDW